MIVKYWQNEILIRYWSVKSTKGTIVILHGYGEHSGKYEPIAQYFNEHGFDVCAVDLYGHGLSSGERGYIKDFKVLIDDIAKILQADQKKYPLFLLGHSLGGNLAIQLAHRHKNLFHAVFLSAPMLHIPNTNFIHHYLIWGLSYFWPNVILPYTKVGAKNLSRNSVIQNAYLSDDKIYKDGLKIGMLNNMFQACANVQNQILDFPFYLALGSQDCICDIHITEKFYQIHQSSSSHFKLYPEFYHELLFEPNNDILLSDCLSFFHQYLPSF